MNPYIKKLERFRLRREKIIALAAKHGTTEAARRLKISRQRVNQIVKGSK